MTRTLAGDISEPVVRQMLGEPDPFQLRYHIELREAVATVVRAHIAGEVSAALLTDWTAHRIRDADRGHFIEIVKIEIAALHEGNFARFRIKPAEFAAWKQIAAGYLGAISTAI